MMSHVKISLLAIDESHCISQVCLVCYNLHEIVIHERVVVGCKLLAQVFKGKHAVCLFWFALNTSASVPSPSKS